MTDEVIEKLKRAADELANRERDAAFACRNCGFFAVRGEQKTGECRRYPPSQPIVAGEDWAWPVIHRDDVCGEFVHKRTGKSFQADPYRQMAGRVAWLEDEIERLRRPDQ